MPNESKLLQVINLLELCEKHEGVKIPRAIFSAQDIIWALDDNSTNLLNSVAIEIATELAVSGPFPYAGHHSEYVYVTLDDLDIDPGHAEMTFEARYRASKADVIAVITNDDIDITWEEIPHE